jgi:hypothetical protein
MDITSIYKKIKKQLKEQQVKTNLPEIGSYIVSISETENGYLIKFNDGNSLEVQRNTKNNFNQFEDNPINEPEQKSMIIYKQIIGKTPLMKI